jgi:hypothetical protein
MNFKYCGVGFYNVLVISNFELHDVNFIGFFFLHLIYRIHDYVLLNLCVYWVVGQLISSDELPDNNSVPIRVVSVIRFLPVRIITRPCHVSVSNLNYLYPVSYPREIN